MQYAYLLVLICMYVVLNDIATLSSKQEFHNLDIIS